MIEYTDSQFDEAMEELLAQYRDKERISALVDAMFGPTGVQELEDDFRDIRNYHVLANAQGAQLDQWGTLIGEEREGLPDDLYRGFIRARAAVNYLGASRSEMAEIAARLPGVPVRSRIKTSLTGSGGTTVPEGSLVKDDDGNKWRTRVDVTLDDTVFLESETTVLDDQYPHIDASKLDTTSGKGGIISDVSGWNEAVAQEASVSGVRYSDSFPAGYRLVVTVEGAPSSSTLDKMRRLLLDAKPAGVLIGILRRSSDYDKFFRLDTGNGHQLDSGKLGSTL